MIFNQTGGGGSPELQAKTTSASTSQQIIVPDAGFDGLSQVTVNPALLETKSVTPSTSQQIITPSSGYYGMGQVTVSGARLTTLSKEGSIFRNRTFSPSSPYIGYDSVTIFAPSNACVPTVLDLDEVANVSISNLRIAINLESSVFTTNYPQTIYGCTGILIFDDTQYSGDSYDIWLCGGSYSTSDQVFYGWCNVMHTLDGEDTWESVCRTKIQYNSEFNNIWITPLTTGLASTTWSNMLNLSEVTNLEWYNFTHTQGNSDFTLFWK